ncbi:MAG TPA: hypothetical protein VEA19_02795 [Actinomycetota bacterium]|nr:hypothetical protein [Actinomycetota bacterium]
MPKIVVFVTGLIVAAAAVPSAGAQSTEITSVQLDRTVVEAGQTLRLTGSMAVTEQPGLKKLWTDTTVTGDVTAFQYPSSPSVDIVEGFVEHARPGDPLTMEIRFAPELGAEPGPTPFQWYRWPFQIGDRWYFVELTYVQGGPAFEWRGSWYYCRLALGNNCVHGTTPLFPVTWSPLSRRITGKIPIRDLGAAQSDGILPQDEMRPFSNSYPPESGHKTPGATLGQDRAPAFEPILLPIESVFLGIAPRGTPADSVQYTQKALPTPAAGSLDVPFSALVETETMSAGDYDLWVKGCFGPCDVRVVPFTVSG